MGHLTCVGHTRDELERDPRVLRRRRRAQRAGAARRPGRRARARRGRRRGRPHLRLRARRAGPRRWAASRSAWRRSPRATRRRRRSSTTPTCWSPRPSAGAEFAVTQMFFRAAGLLRPGRAGPRARRRHPDPAGHHADPEPQRRSAGWASCPAPRCPAEVMARISGLADDPAAVRAEGIEIATELCEALLAGGAPGPALLHAEPVEGDARDLRGAQDHRLGLAGRNVLPCARSPSPATARPGSRPTPPSSASPPSTAPPASRRRSPASRQRSVGDRHGRPPLHRREPDRLPGAHGVAGPRQRGDAGRVRGPALARRSRCDDLDAGRRAGRPRWPPRSATGSRSRACRSRCPTPARLRRSAGGGVRRCGRAGRTPGRRWPARSWASVQIGQSRASCTCPRSSATAPPTAAYASKMEVGVRARRDRRDRLRDGHLRAADAMVHDGWSSGRAPTTRSSWTIGSGRADRLRDQRGGEADERQAGAGGGVGAGGVDARDRGGGAEPAADGGRGPATARPCGEPPQRSTRSRGAAVDPGDDLRADVDPVPGQRAQRCPRPACRGRAPSTPARPRGRRAAGADDEHRVAVQHQLVRRGRARRPPGPGGRRPAGSPASSARRTAPGRAAGAGRPRTTTTSASSSPADVATAADPAVAHDEVVDVGVGQRRSTPRVSSRFASAVPSRRHPAGHRPGAEASARGTPSARPRRARCAGRGPRRRRGGRRPAAAGRP